MTPELALFIFLFAIFLGCWIRILLPFIRKNLQDEDLAYSHKYTIIFILTYIMAMVAAVFTFQANPPDLTKTMNDLFIQGLMAGFTSEAIILEIAKLALPPDWWD